MRSQAGIAATFRAITHELFQGQRFGPYAVSELTWRKFVPTYLDWPLA